VKKKKKQSIVHLVGKQSGEAIHSRSCSIRAAETQLALKSCISMLMLLCRSMFHGNLLLFLYRLNFAAFRYDFPFFSNCLYAISVPSIVSGSVCVCVGVAFVKFKLDIGQIYRLLGISIKGLDSISALFQGYK
jgi:hypothetical protein